MKKHKIVSFIFIVIFSVFIIEMCLRLAGVPPYKPVDYSFEVEPKMCYINDSLGLKLLPGQFNININNGLKFQVTHNLEGERITSLNPIDNSEKEIHIYGCSYTYGTGVNDNQTYPFLLQNNFPNYKITNFATPSFGTIQFYLQLKNNIQQNKIPDIVILNCADFHEERNLLSQSYLYKLYQGFETLKKTEELKSKFFPKIANTSSNNIEVEYVNIFNEYKPFPYRKFSSILNLIEKNTIKEPTNLKSSFKIIIAISSLCKEKNIELIVTDIFHQSDKIKDFCLDENINFVNISPDFSNNSYNNLPYDIHPSKEAHKVYSEKMIVYLKEFLKEKK